MTSLSSLPQLLRESIAEHKPHIDKLLKIGPQLAELSAHEGEAVTRRYTEAERRYLAIKKEVKGRAMALDEAVSQSAQVLLVCSGADGRSDVSVHVCDSSHQTFRGHITLGFTTSH